MNAAHALTIAAAILAIGAPFVMVSGRVEASGARPAALLAIGTSVLAAAFGLFALAADAGTWQLPIFLGDAIGIDLPNRVAGGGTIGAIAVTVLLITAAIQTYAAWYLADDDRYAAFAGTVGLFAAAMLLLVISRDLILTLIGWEVMGWCSYLLIGHWSRKESARRAAYKAFIVTRLADVGFVVGVVALVAIAKTSDLDRLTVAVGGVGSGTLTFALVALVIGVLGKSAQVPFQDWLTDAMEGPTPASALIHAATMVAAGTWVLAQVAPLLFLSATAQWVLGISVAVTMVFAGFTAFLQTDLKRLLAWSTISQIAVMLAPLAAAPNAVVGADASTAHLYGHAIFKALLFLTVGWLAVLGGSTAARSLRGTGLGTPIARIGWAAGLLALAGVPLTVGGFSKEHVIDATSWAESGGHPGVRQGVITLALLLTVALTAAYATRALVVVELDRKAPEEPTGADTHHPSRPTMAAQGVIAVLALGSLLGGLAFLTDALPGTHLSFTVLAISLVLLSLGAVVGFQFRPDDRLAPNRWMAKADKGFGADPAYLAVVARPVLALARMAAFLDTEVIDLYVRGAGSTSVTLARAGGRVHERERVSSNLVWVFIGFLAIAGVALWR